MPRRVIDCAVRDEHDEPQRCDFGEEKHADEVGPGGGTHIGFELAHCTRCGRVWDPASDCDAFVA